MKIVAISDIHGYLVPYQKLARDYFDVLCICGDLAPLDIQSKMAESEKWFKEDFREWCEKMPCDKVVFIAGNHDRYLEKMLKTYTDAKSLSEYLEWPEKMVFLHDSSYVYQEWITEEETVDYHFYGTPWFPFLNNWAFYKDSEGLSEAFEKIPDCDVLLTHTPGKNMFDTGRIMQYTYGKEIGSSELTDVILRRHIGFWFCGHIHSGNHELSEFTDPNFACYGMKVANVSIKDERYEPVYKPLEIEYCKH
jgi:Icc-related predicted phosphoesterase